MSEQEIISTNDGIKSKPNLARLGPTGSIVGGGIPGPGRPKGSRSKLAESFYNELYADWQAHGVEAISKMRTKSPGEYCKLIAYCLPKDVIFNPDQFQTMRPDDIADFLVNLKAQLIGQANTGSEPTET